MPVKTFAEVEASLRQEGLRTTYPADLPRIPPLPAQRYSDPRFFALEIEHVFKKSWIAVGHLSELPQTGSYKLFEEFDQSVIISRGADDVVRAFRNACRHRAAALLTEKTGIARRFTCPYHAWSYASDGTLITVPESQNFACLNKDNLPLLKLRCETWRGFIFINFDTAADPLLDFIAPIAAEVDDFPFEQMTVKGIVSLEIDCNWKIAYDNFLESYHVNVVHQKTIAPYIDTKTWTVDRFVGGHGCFRVSKRNGDSIFKSENISADGISVGSDDVPSRYRNFTIAVPRFPNGTAGLDPAGFNWQSFWPITPDRCRMVNLYLGLADDNGPEKQQYWSDFIAYNDSILAEDMHLFGSIQRSIRAGDISHLTLSVQEQFIQWYHEHLDHKIGVANVPADLRAPSVLTDARH